jgi:hypothetical protein
MFTPETKLWLSRVGMLLEFLSFWLVAPEILGIERLKRWENDLETWLKNKDLSNHLKLIGLVATYIVVIGWVIFLAIWGFSLLMSGIDFQHPNLMPSLIYLATSLLVALLVRLFVAGLLELTQPIGKRLIQSVTSPILRALEDDTKISRRSLMLGAGLYILSFLLQFWTTF